MVRARKDNGGVGRGRDEDSILPHPAGRSVWAIARIVQITPVFSVYNYLSVKKKKKMVHKIYILEVILLLMEAGAGNNK